MRVCLAVNWNDSKADEIVDVPDGVGRNLLHAGKARKPTPEDLAAAAAPPTEVTKSNTDETPPSGGVSRTKGKTQ